MNAQSLEASTSTTLGPRPTAQGTSRAKRAVPVAHAITVAAAVMLGFGATGCTDPVPGRADTNGVEVVVTKALAQVGDQYVFGVEVSETDPDPDVWDQGELTRWAAYQGGAKIPGSSSEQYLDLKAKGLLIPVDEGIKTRGALLFHFSSEPVRGEGAPGDARVALSMGDGRSVEARSDAGVVVDSSAEGQFNYAALLPGLNYASTSTAPTPNGQASETGTSDLTIEQVMYGIKMQESNGDYQAEDPTSTASGAYFYIDGEWDRYGGYSHASDAPPEVQDDKMRADTAAAYGRLGDWERVIATHYAGEDGQAGAKSDWVTKVPGDIDHHPSIRDYVDAVLLQAKTAKLTTTAPTTTR